MLLALVVAVGDARGGDASLAVARPGPGFATLRGDPYAGAAGRHQLLRPRSAARGGACHHCSRQPEQDSPIRSVAAALQAAIFSAGQYCRTFPTWASGVGRRRGLQPRASDFMRAHRRADSRPAAHPLLDLNQTPLDTGRCRGARWRSRSALRPGASARTKSEQVCAHRQAEDKRGRIVVSHRGRLRSGSSAGCCRLPLGLTHAMSMDGGRERSCARMRRRSAASFARWEPRAEGVPCRR